MYKRWTDHHLPLSISISSNVSESSYRLKATCSISSRDGNYGNRKLIISVEIETNTG